MERLTQGETLSRDKGAKRGGGGGGSARAKHSHSHSHCAAAANDPSEQQLK